EDEARVRDVERAPLFARELEIQDVAAAKLDERRFVFGAGEPPRSGELLLVALDSDHRAARDRARHRAGELAETAAEVDDALVAAERHLAHLGVVQQHVVHQRQAALFLFGGAVDVNRVAHLVSTGYPASSHASKPPASGRTGLNPRSISMRATRAAEASFGHVQ